MSLFNMDDIEESALDAFLADQDVRDIWLDKGDESALKSLLAERARSAQTQVNKKQKTEKVVESQAPVRITVSMDETKAWAELNPMLKGIAPESIEELLYLSLEEERITYGVRKHQISRLSKNPIFGMPLLVAEGKMPQEGKEGAIHFNFDTNMSIRPTNRNDYSVDVDKPGFVQVVKSGALLCTSTKTSTDYTGVSVRGNKIYPKTGGVDDVKAGDNVQLVADGRRWYAVEDGEIVYQNGILSVYPILKVDEVDVESGNINFNGSVYIKGSVNEGATVEASGNIVIGGGISNCNIKAGGHLVVGSGAKGGENYFVTVGGSFRTPFIEYLNVKAQGDIYTDVILGGNIHCDGAVFAVGKRGRIAGAHLKAREITAEEIGNSAGAKTTLEIIAMKELEEKIHSLRQEAGGWKAREDSMHKIIKETTSKSRQDMLAPIYSQIVEHHRELKKDMEEAERSLDLVKSKYAFEIRALGVIHPKVSCILYGKNFNNEKTYNRSHVYYRDGLVQIGHFYGSDPF